MNDEGAAAAKALFGRPLRIVLAEWIRSRDGVAFYQQEAMDAMRNHHEASSGVKKELATFVQFEMLARVESSSRVYFQPVESPFWDAYEQLRRAVVAYEAKRAKAVGTQAADPDEVSIQHGRDQ